MPVAGQAMDPVVTTSVPGAFDPLSRNTATAMFPDDVPTPITIDDVETLPGVTTRLIALWNDPAGTVRASELAVPGSSVHKRVAMYRVSSVESENEFRTDQIDVPSES